MSVTSNQLLYEVLERASYRWNTLSFFRALTGNIPSNDQTEFLRDIPNLDIPKMVVCAARGSGKTYTLAVVALWYCLILSKSLNRPVTVIVLAGSLEQSNKLYALAREFISKTQWVHEEVSRSIKTSTTFKDGSELKILTASEKAIRGQHGDLLIIDEAVEAGTAHVKAAFQIPITSDHPRTIMSSTPHDYSSLFVDAYEKYQEYGYKRYPIWSAINAPWISRTEIEAARKRYTENDPFFQIEYLGKPVPMTGNVFPLKDITDYVRTTEKPEWNGTNTMAGVDWGHVAPTVLTIVEKQGEDWVVLFSQGRSLERFEDLQDWILEVTKSFNSQVIRVDSEDEGENQRLEDKGYPVDRIIFKAKKPLMIANLRTMVEKHRIRVWEGHADLVYQLAHYTYGQKTDDDHLDSLMMAVKDEMSLDFGPEVPIMTGTRTPIRYGITGPAGFQEKKPDKEKDASLSSDLPYIAGERKDARKRVRDEEGRRYHPIWDEEQRDQVL